MWQLWNICQQRGVSGQNYIIVIVKTNRLRQNHVVLLELATTFLIKDNYRVHMRVRANYLYNSHKSAMSIFSSETYTSIALICTCTKSTTLPRLCELDCSNR